MKKSKINVAQILNIVLALAVVALLYRGKLMEKKQSKVTIETKTEYKKLPVSRTGGSNIVADIASGEITLPIPSIESDVSVEEAMYKRRSVRSYDSKPLLISELSQILWSGYGVTHPMNENGDGLKTAPSAGGLYPLELYVMVNDIVGLEKGFYKYISAGHKLESLKDHSIIEEFGDASNHKPMVTKSAAVIVFAGNPNKLFGDPVLDLRWTNMEVGHVSQNIYLQATALEVGTCALGHIKEKELQEILEIPKEEQVLYLMPLGKLAL